MRGISLYVAVFFCDILSSVECAPACTKNSAPTTLSISYKTDGSFVSTPGNLETTGSDKCFIVMSVWNDNSVNVELSDDCSNNSPLTFTRSTGGAGLPAFEYGKTFTFRLIRYTDQTKTTAVCETSTFSITPALCRGGSYALSSLNVIKRPNSIVEAFLSNKPLTGDCVYYLLSWAGSSAVDTTTKADCSGTSFSKAGFTYGTAYTIGFANFASGANIASAQPVCGINSVTITPAASSATMTISDISYGVVKVALSGSAWGSKCEVSLGEWDGVDQSSKALRRTSNDCSFVTFSSEDVGAAFGYGTAYSFEMAEYAITDSNTAVVNPRSSLATVSTTIAADTCAGSNLVFSRLDPVSVGVSITGGKSYAACRMTMVEYDGTVKSMVRVGLCSSFFRFTADGDVWFEGAKTAKFKYEVFPDGDITGQTTCTPTVSSYSITAYNCAQAIAMSEGVGQYVFSVQSPQPMVGTCKLLISNCAGSSQDPMEISFPSCLSSFALTYSDLVTSLTDLAPGTSCDFNWKYYNGSSSVCSSSGSAITTTIIVPLTVTQGTAASGSISVDMSAGLPSALTSYFTSSGKTSACKAHNTGCNGLTVATPTIVTITGCNTAVSLTADMTAGDNCVVRVYAYASTDLNTPLGFSGDLSFSAAGVPAWGSTQVPTVQMFGDSCMEVTWLAPSSTGGATILCYEVQRKDSTGSYYVAQNCTIGNTETSAITCGFSEGVDYSYQVIAVNRIGRSADQTSVSIAQRLEYLQSAPASDYLTPTSSQKTFVAGAFPSIQVQENNPTSTLGGLDTATTDRLFVATLVSRCKLDATTTIKASLSSSDTDYTSATLPVPPNSPPAFTEVFEPVQGSPGVYRLVVTYQPPAGAYSLITYSLEAGGLYGQYWSNPSFSGNTPTLVRKDPIMNFDWVLGPLINSTSARFYDMVSIRWTGFIEAEYTESYTLFVEANNDQVRVWVDDVIIINKWEADDLCASVCSGSASLQQSSASGRKFSSIRIDFVHSKGPAQAKSAEFVLKWVSFSQPLEVIPSQRLFKGRAIQSTAKTINVIPDVVSAGTSTFSLQSQAFNTDSTYSIIVYAKDTYGNVLQSADTQFKATFTGATTFTFTSVAVNANLNNGTYTIPFQITDAGTYSVAITEVGSAGAVSGSPISITVSTGAAYEVSGAAVVGASHAASTAVVFTFDVKDSNGNIIDGSALTTMPSIHVSALWTGDSVTQARLPVDDVSWRSTRFGTLFTDAGISYSGGKFRATITLPRAGLYNIDIGVDNGATPDSLTGLLVASSGASTASYALVVSTPFPPTDMAVNAATSVTVQLRDQYMNAISTTLSGSPAVYIRLQGHPTSSNQVLCAPPGTNGQYTCAITPEVSGTNLALSIVVDGTFASYVYDNSGTIMYSRGPWYVNVTSGAVSASDCLLTGVRNRYTAGVAVNATLLLRDSKKNTLGPVSSWPTISAVLTDGAATTITMDTATFVYDTKSGIVNIPIVATQTDTGLTLEVVVDGSLVPLPYGISAGDIDIVDGVVDADATSCAAYSTGTAGTAFAGLCTTRDAQNNEISWTNLYTYATFVHTTDQDLSDITATGTVKAGFPSKWEFTTSSLTKVGTYWYYTTVAQPGGLMAQYYSLSSFSSLIGIGGTPLSKVMSGDVSPTLYTQIDPFLDFDYQGPISIDGVTALSVVWTGSVLSPISGASAAVTFNIIATGGVKITVGATVVDFLSAASVDETFDVTMAQDAYYPIEVQYIPDNVAALSLTWYYTGAPISAQFVVPPAKLHTLLSTESSLNTVDVSIASVSTQSTATFSTGIVAGQPDFVIIQAVDTYGNEYTSLPNCVDGSGNTNDPTCLYQVTLVQSDGTTFQAAVDLQDGTVKVPVTFATDGPKDVNVKLKLSGGTTSHIQGSPYSIVVNPASSR